MSIDWEALEADARKRRRRTRKQAEADLKRVLDNADGFAKLADLSDEEWAAAEAQDAEGADAGA